MSHSLRELALDASTSKQIAKDAALLNASIVEIHKVLDLIESALGSPAIRFTHKYHVYLPDRHQVDTPYIELFGLSDIAFFVSSDDKLHVRHSGVHGPVGKIHEIKNMSDLGDALKAMELEAPAPPCDWVSGVPILSEVLEE